MNETDARDLLAIVRSAVSAIYEMTDERTACAAVLHHLREMGCPDVMLSFVRRYNDMAFVVGEVASGRMAHIVGLTRRPIDGPTESLDVLCVVLKRREPYFITDSRSDFFCDPRAVQMSAIVSQYIVPLVADSTPLGVLQIAMGERESRPDDLCNAIDILASSLSFAIEKRRSLANLRLQWKGRRVSRCPEGPQTAGAPSGELMPSRAAIDHENLIAQLESIPVGAAQAARYHDFIVDALETIFHPYLFKPVKEQNMHEGRKRVDVVFNNGRLGFFGDLALLHGIRCPYVFVECKNYSTDPKNPELDQISGRFSGQRGMFGILVCREVQDRGLMRRRCRDMANDGRGYVLVLDDHDIKELLRLRGAPDESGLNDYLDDCFRTLVM